MRGVGGNALVRAVTAVVAGVLAAAVLVAVPAPAGAYKDWGWIRAADQPLRKGCGKYWFKYKVDTPRDEWLAEMFVVTPNGVGLHHTMKDGDFDPNRNRVRFTVCKNSTQYGRHKLRMKLTWYENDIEQTSHTGWVKPSYFRLYRP